MHFIGTDNMVVYINKPAKLQVDRILRVPLLILTKFLISNSSLSAVDEERMREFV